MELQFVEIENFRSIENAKIDFVNRCGVLVGINESGKSNVLKALASLGSYQPSQAHDVREPLPGENPVEKSRIRFSFKFDQKETKQLCDDVSARVLSSDGLRAPLITGHGRHLTIAEVVQSRNYGVYQVDVINGTKGARYYLLDDGWTICDGWMKPSEACPDNTTVDVKGVGSVALKEAKLVRRSDFDSLPDEYFAPAELEDVSRAIGIAVMAKVRGNLPDVLFWEYAEENLLPSSVNAEQFAANPDSCIPLKNMFILAGYEDITSAIANVQKKSRNAIENFYAGVANKTTAHFRSVWKDYRALQFELKPDGDLLRPGVREKNVYDFAQRSDGFKRFVSFLLMISAKVKSGVLANTLLLIDEPDVSLHPSGARFLRDELIRISKTNYVVYSTHSIFMIDREDIGRHIIVRKENERTNLLPVKDSNFIEEEVIYNAVGYSIFEILRDKNIIFEGWRDKQLFNVATRKLSSLHPHVKNTFQNIGRCHSQGVKQIKMFTPLMELAERYCLIISDADQPAKDQQKVHQESNSYGIWKRYDEVLGPECGITTGEDFLKPSAFRSGINAARDRYPTLPQFDESKLDDPRGKVYAINHWLTSGGLDKDTRKAELNRIKDGVFNNLKASEIEESYSGFLSNLADLISGDSASESGQKADAGH